MNRISKSTLVDQCMKNTLEPYRFLRLAKLVYLRRADDCSQIIKIPTSRWGSQIGLSPWVSVRFPEIQKIIHPDDKSLQRATLGTPLHFICRDGKYFDWRVETKEDIEAAVGEMMIEITTAGFQYFQRYSTLTAVEEALARSIIPNEFILNLAHASGLLAACRLQRGDFKAALQTIDDGLAHKFCKTPAMKRLLEEERAKIIAAAELRKEST
jgi:hypothetical protein